VFAIKLGQLVLDVYKGSIKFVVRVGLSVCVAFGCDGVALDNLGFSGSAIS